MLKKLLLTIIGIALVVTVLAPTALAGTPPPATVTETTPTNICKPTETAVTCKLASASASCPAGYDKDKVGTEDNACRKGSSKITDPTTLKKIATVVQMQKVLSQILWPVLLMTGGLLDNSLIFGNGMEERLREIWIPIRNIVNILFVIALIGIALYNVLGLGEEGGNYSIKAILPKIVVGIIVVNFSFLGIKIFLDGVSVLTTAIFAIPNQVGASELVYDEDTQDRLCRGIEGKDFGETLTQLGEEKRSKEQISLMIAKSPEYKDDFKEEPFNLNVENLTYADLDAKLKDDSLDRLAKAIVIDFNADVAEGVNKTICIAQTTTSTVDGKPTSTTKYHLSTSGELFLKRYNNRSAPLAMALGLGNIILYPELKADSLQDMEKIFINTVLSVLMYVLFAASFIALFVVLLGRMVVIWLAIVLSPILLLGIVIPAVKENFSGFSDITNQFVKNAIAPIGIALSMSIGWIMLRALQGVNALNASEGPLNLSVTKGIPVLGLSTLQDLIVGVGTLAVIWIGVFTAASSSVAAPITDSIKGSLQSAGKFVGTLPMKHIPFFRIDLPGSKDDNNNRYTFDQLMHAKNTMMGEPSDVNKLSKLINPSSLSSTDLSNAKNVGEVKDFLGRARTKNWDAEKLKAALKGAEHNSSFKKYMRDNSGTPAVKAINDLLKTKSKGEKAAKNKATRDIYANVDPVSSGSGMPTGLNKEQNFTIGSNTAKVNMFSVLQSAYNSNGTVADTERKLKAIIDKIKVEGMTGTPADIRKLVKNNEAWSKLQKRFGGPTQLDEKIKDLFRTPPPSTTPPPPSTT